MTAPDWAVEAWDAAWRAAWLTGVETHDSDQAAALELSRRCVPVEEYQRVVGENARLRDTAAKIHNSVNIVGSAYHRAQTALDEMVSEIKSDLRAALKETTNADRLEKLND